ncbi:LytR/AlgR family response regulator transcription factor [Algoriphagus halophytocola]|uniref:LytTR family DNA-binding domain-containing protein n=1 Tax=Algoriphagus halophytocola TaxID=2991499 RepID=A0ABY6MHM0_9BACT|nr:LytTR family DNA-binding domain-containing protein [Algoriphagus sp. TR-M5]UZD22984.1 LytTR family DNA-binding domain-containing protein [Algoriphagus sp. TR-M5]
MDVLKLVLIDDDPQGLQVLEKIVGDSVYFEIAFSTTEPHMALDYIRSHPVDVIITDILMDKMHGIHLASIVDTLKIPLIICSAYPAYAYDGYQVNAIDFIRKPADPAKFFKAIGKLYPDIKTSKEKDPPYLSGMLVINENGSATITMIRCDNISLISVDGNYVHIQTSSKKHTVLISLTTVMERLPPDKFYRIHRSYAINLEKILKIKGEMVHLDGGYEIPVGSTYYEKFYKIFKNMSINSSRNKGNNSDSGILP